MVCHEHRSNAKNQQLLQQYKDRCIIRQIQLPAFSKYLKLIFHTNQQTTNNNHEVKISSEGKAIYILQTIKVGGQKYSLFYDTGCSDIVSRYNAIKATGGRAVQELPGPISVNGVGNAEVKTTHGI